ncbi:hypothetical protein [Amycolatopsis thermoflava]|uniref:hypothetical protein n=1 Tax=Amycolatopsis thermoflava TaxID=84480 RepID=UPI0037F401FA
MIVTYSPSGQDVQVWTWDPNQVRAKDAELIEDKFDGTWDEFKVQLLQGRMRARRVLLWHLLRGDHPTIKLDDIDFVAEELKLELQPQELQEMRDAVAKATSVPTGKRELALELLDRQIAEAGGPVPKAGSAASASATA